MICRILFVAILLVFAIGTVSEARVLELGDDAPELKVAKWVKGNPVTLAASKDKKIVVVEFWATWCGPCKASIPHLSKLYDSLKDKGVEMVGISNEPAATVESELGKFAFTYNVGVDDGNGTYGAYMDGVAGIPHAFIVDKGGKIAWKGHPMQGMDVVLQQMLAGTYSVEKVKQLEQAKKDLMGAFQSRNPANILEGLEKIIDIDPNVQNIELGQQQLPVFNTLIQFYGRMNKGPDFKALCRRMVSRDDIGGPALNRVAWTLISSEKPEFRDEVLAIDAIKKINPNSNQAFEMKAAFYRQIGKQDDFKALCKSMLSVEDMTAPALNNMAWVLVTVDDVSLRDVQTALAAIKKAIKLKDDPSLRDTLSRVYFEMGLIDKAIGVQEAAVKKEENADRRKVLQANLDYYKAVKAAAATVR